MKRTIIAAIFATIAAPVYAQDSAIYDFCIGVKRTDYSPSYPPSGVRERYGFVHKDSPDCSVIWTSDSLNNPPARPLSYQEYLQAGCSVYDFNGANLTNDIAWCYTVKPAKQNCTRDPFTGVEHCAIERYFWKAVTPDDGDGQ